MSPEAASLGREGRSEGKGDGKKEEIYFGPFEVGDQIFHKTPLCYALVNIKPLIPGHVLVIPLRRVARLTSLSSEEIADLFVTVTRVQRMLGGVYFAGGDGKGEGDRELVGEKGKAEERGGGFNIAVQDGREAGQTVPHVHVHIIPRVKEGGGDEIYDRLASEEGNVGAGLWDRFMQQRPRQQGQFPRIEEESRKPRTKEEMNAEAEFFRGRMGLLEEEVV